MVDIYLPFLDPLVSLTGFLALLRDFLAVRFSSSLMGRVRPNAATKSEPHAIYVTRLESKASTRCGVER